ncbi:MAG: metalloregulator ArsR/SmtB family transcription factor [Gammaproteobacteria bacterium]|nr:metalloregulator ArsR/SmtB family transcription factor [Gammaproteobacteria bacterium]
MSVLVHGLKAVADPTRLRLLALLSRGELAVHEICEVLAQSQPRVSRHLRLLAEAGFLDRFREQQLVYYRAPVAGQGRAWWELLRQMLDSEDPQLTRDRERMSAVIAERARAAAAELQSQSPSAEAPEALNAAEDLATVVLEELGPVGIGALLDVGTGSGRMLEVLGRRAQHAVGVDISTSALKLARTRVHGAGLAHVEFHRGDMYRLPSADGRFDLVNLDRVLAGAERPEAALREAARTLKDGGRLLIVDRYDAIEARGGNPLLLLRRWLTAAELEAQRLLPCELEGGHFIMALAGRPAAQRGEAA